MVNGSNFKRTYVARNCARTADVTSANLMDKIAYGEIYILDEKGKILDNDEASRAKGIKIVQGTKDGAPLVSQVFWKDDIKEYAGSKFLQLASQKLAFGYNGTSGSLEVIGLNSYGIGLEFQMNNPVGNGDPYITRVAYESKASGDTQFNIANQLAQVLSKDFEQFNEAQPIVNVITSTSGAAGLTGCEVVKGSRAVTYTGGTPLVGNVYIVPGKTGTIYGDEPSGVYVVTSVDTVDKVITLDKTYVGTSQTGIDLNVIADTSADDYGILIETGVYKQFDAYEDYLRPYIIPSYTNFGTSTITLDGTGFVQEFGYGRHEQVRNSELYHQSYWGRNARQRKGLQNPSIVTDEGTGYSSVTFVSETNSKINTLENNGQKVPVTIYLQRGTYEDIAADAAGTAYQSNIQTGDGLSTTDSNSLLNVLNAFMVSAGVVEAGANTVANGGKEMTAGTTYSTGIDV